MQVYTSIHYNLQVIRGHNNRRILLPKPIKMAAIPAKFSNNNNLTN